MAQKAIKPLVIADEPLICKHYRARAEIDVELARLRDSRKAALQAAADDGLLPFAFKVALKLKAMSAFEAKRHLRAINEYAKDLEVMRQTELLD